MWGAESLASGSGNLWLLLATVVTTFGAIASTVITVFHHSGPTRDEISSAVEDAIDEYRDTFTEPLREENRALRKELADERARRVP